MTQLKVTILGCGNSTGVPAVGNYWGKCDPSEPKNRRLRSSIAVQSANTTVIVDTGPDFREQVNRAHIERVDAVLYTHSHGDHVNGIDDLRSLRFRQKQLVPVYGNDETLDDLAKRFDYLFEGGKSPLYPPVVEAQRIEEGQYGQPITHGDIDFIPFPQDHGTCIATGYRFGDLAYSVDMLTLDDFAVKVLTGIKTWIVDCASYNDPNNTVHANIDTILKLNEKIGAGQVILSSLSLSMDYQTLKQELPLPLIPGYDQMSISIFQS